MRPEAFGPPCPAGDQPHQQDRDARLDPSRRARDCFPLPCPPKVLQEGRLSRRSQQRLTRKARAQEDVRETVKALNWMNGFSPSLEFEGPPDHLQKQVLDRAVHLTEMAWQKGTLPVVPSEEAALAELLKGRGEYEDSSVPVTLARFEIERISLPETLDDVPDVASVLPEEALRYLESPELMIRQEVCQDEPIVPYYDPSLKNSRKNYRLLMQKLHDIGYLRFTFSPKARAGLFFVHKSDRKRVRMIVDARPANQLFDSPPSVQLCTAEGFARIEIAAPTDLQPGTAAFEDHLRRQGLFFGLADVKDCFHRMRQPAWLSKYFCWDPIPARWMKGLVGTDLEGFQVKATDYVYPMPASLCMGFSWSLYFAQRANEHLMTQIPSLSESTLVSDRGPPVVFGPGSTEKVRHYVYVDNLGIISPHQAVVEKGLKELGPCFDGRGLVLRPGEIQHEDIKALGCSMRGDMMATRITPSRFIRLRQAIGAVLRRKKVSGRVLEVVLGHITFCCLCNRQLLCIFSAIYKFIKRCYFAPAKLWDSVRIELWAFRSLMIYLHSDWWRPWNPLVSASDSSLEGYGVSVSFWDPQQVASCGRRLERSRFRKQASTAARSHALASAGFVKDEVTECWKRREVSDEELLEGSGWQLSDDFEEIPAPFLAKTLWEPKLWGKWEFNAGILELEARALVKSLRRVALSVFGSDIRQLLLADNMAVVLSFDRFRARNYRLLKQIRVFTSYLLARNIAATVRWIPSEFNNSDEPSRIFSDEESKLLTSLIPAPDVAQKGSKSAASSRETQESSTSGPSEVSAQDSKCAKTGAQPAETQCEASLGNAYYPLSTEFLPARRGPVGASGEWESQETEVSFKKFHKQHFGARSKGVTSQKAGQETVPQVGEHDHGRRRSHSARKECHWREEPQGLQKGIGRVQSICSPSRLGSHRCSITGSAPDPVSEQDLPPRPPGLQGRPLDGGNLPFPPTVWQNGVRKAAQDVACPEGFSQTDSRPKPSTLSFDGVGSYGGGTPPHGQTSHGSLRPRFIVQLRQALGIDPPPSLLFGEASAGRDFKLEFVDESRGAGHCVQDGRIRQQCGPGQSLADHLGTSPVWISQAEPSSDSALGLRLWSVQRCLQASSHHLGPGPDSLSGPPLGPFHRPSPELPQPAGSDAKRAMEIPNQCDALREVSTFGSHSGKFDLKPPSSLSHVRGKPWGDHAGIPLGARLRRKQVMHGYVMDLFAGTGGVSYQCERIGYFTKQWDIRNGPLQDLTQPRVVRRLLREIRKGRVLAVMMAPSCTGFSRARDRTKVIRNHRFPWGIPQRFLTEQEKQLLHVGNACFRTCIKLISELNQRCIPWVLENPWSSRCWNLPPTRQLLQQQQAFLCRGDFCQWGTKWRKPTGFLYNHILDSHRLSRPCSGHNGQCCRTGQPHKLLSGTCPTGVPWAIAAEPYPSKLCCDLAHVLTSKYHATSSF